MLGIRQYFRKSQATAVAASVVPVTIGLSAPIAASQQMKFRYVIPLSVGAAGGVRLIPTIPAGSSINQMVIKLFNTVAPSITTAIQLATAAPTAFTNALANAGNHWVEVELQITNGATSGTVDLQMAQNTSDATPMTALVGAFLETVTVTT